MEFKECVDRANEVVAEIKVAGGDSFIVGEFLRACQQPRVLISRIELVFDAVPVCLDEIYEDNYKEVIKSRVVEEFKHQILKLQEAVKKLGGEL